MAFLVIVIGVAFLTSTSNTIQETQAPGSVVNETFTWNTGAVVSLAKYPVESIVSITNSSNSTDFSTNTSSYTIDTQYGKLTIVGNNSILVGHCDEDEASACYITYNYYDGYIKDSAGRQVTLLIGLMLAIAILGGVIALIYPSIKEL